MIAKMKQKVENKRRFKKPFDEWRHFAGEQLIVSSRLGTIDNNRNINALC